MYNRIDSIEYAKKWAFSFNPKFYDFSGLGGDCTNFVSQCIYAGGIPMNYMPYGWYYSSLSSRAPAWTGVNEFWNFGISNDSIGLKIRECGLEQAETGDVVQLYNGAVYYHTLLITEIKGSGLTKEFFVAAHDSAAFNRPLLSYGAINVRFGKVLS